VCLCSPFKRIAIYIVGLFQESQSEVSTYRQPWTTFTKWREVYSILNKEASTMADVPVNPWDDSITSIIMPFNICRLPRTRLKSDTTRDFLWILGLID
jgi:hypothetical protein